MSIRDRLRRKPTQTSTTAAPATSTSRPTGFDPTPYVDTTPTYDSGHHSTPSHCDTSSHSTSHCDPGSY
ncbi:hypothetical protein ACFY3M_50640 [Streptomyces mirabilis]|uniref:hypothetical protein n=1 Tax=Streptomyces mirabilis TaxID=68239 RepID=UPI00369C83F3